MDHNNSQQTLDASYASQLNGRLFDAEPGNTKASVFNWFRDLTKVNESLDDRRRGRRKRVKIAILDTGIYMGSSEFCSENARKRIVKQEDFLNDSNNPSRVTALDECGHGTHCAALLRRVAPDAEIYVARVAKDFNSGIDPKRVSENWDVDIISMSFGFYKTYGDVDRALHCAVGRDKLIFAAASNDGTTREMAFPARRESIICINSANEYGAPSSFNPPFKAGKSLTILGENVESAWIPEGQSAAPKPGGDPTRKSMSGTSMATPIAAGAAALLLEIATNPSGEEATKIFEQYLRYMKTYSGMNDLLGKASVPVNSYNNIVISQLFSLFYPGEKIDYARVARWVENTLRKYRDAIGEEGPGNHTRTSTGGLASIADFPSDQLSTASNRKPIPTAYIIIAYDTATCWKFFESLKRLVHGYSFLWFLFKWTALDLALLTLAWREGKVTWQRTCRLIAFIALTNVVFGLLPAQLLHSFWFALNHFDRHPNSVLKQGSGFAASQPGLSLVGTETITQHGDAFQKKDACQGDVDGFDVMLKNSHHTQVNYVVRHQPINAKMSISKRTFDASPGMMSIVMDTSKPGYYTYSFLRPPRDQPDLDLLFLPLVLTHQVHPRPTASFNNPGQIIQSCMIGQEEVAIPITMTGLPPLELAVEIKNEIGIARKIHQYHFDTVSTELRIPRAHFMMGFHQIRIRAVSDSTGCANEVPSYSSPAVQVQFFNAPSIYALDSAQDYCVGKGLDFSLAGMPPFNVTYRFGDLNFEKIVSKGQLTCRMSTLGNLTITSISTGDSACRTATNITRSIHPFPECDLSVVEAGAAQSQEEREWELIFRFKGTPPFEFEYTRSVSSQQGTNSMVLQTHRDISYEYEKRIRVGPVGIYQIVSIRDKYCIYTSSEAMRQSY